MDREQGGKKREFPVVAGSVPAEQWPSASSFFSLCSASFLRECVCVFVCVCVCVCVCSVVGVCVCSVMGVMMHSAHPVLKLNGKCVLLNVHERFFMRWGVWVGVCVVWCGV